MAAKQFIGKRGLYLSWATLFVYGGFLFNFGPYSALKAAIGGKELPEERFGVKGAEFYQFLEKIGAPGLQTYSNFQILDYLNGILLAFALFCTLYVFLERLGASQNIRSILVLPVSMGILDVLENTGFLYLVNQYPAKLEGFYSYVAFVTNAKLVFGMFGFLALIFCAAAMIGKAIFGRIREE
ncbi:MAG: hypothetical protein KDB79_14760 [Acidobacteria bacterium]|nr:hypothetical protein [Acidobacteriota bacterium]